MKLIYTGPIEIHMRLDENGEQVWNGMLVPFEPFDVAPAVARRLSLRDDMFVAEAWPSGESPEDMAAAVSTDDEARAVEEDTGRQEAAQAIAERDAALVAIAFPPAENSAEKPAVDPGAGQTPAAATNLAPPPPPPPPPLVAATAPATDPPPVLTTTPTAETV